MRRKFLNWKAKTLISKASTLLVAADAEKMVIGSLIEYPSIISKVRLNAALFSDVNKPIVDVVQTICYERLKSGRNDPIRLAEIKARLTIDESVLSEMAFYASPQIDDAIFESISRAYESRMNVSSVIPLISEIDEMTDASSIDAINLAASEVIASYSKAIEEVERNTSRKIDVDAVLKHIYSPSARAEVESMPALMSAIGGFRMKEMTIYAASLGSGKSAFATQIALNLAETGTPAAFISLEMSDVQLMTRCAALALDVDDFSVKSGFLQQDKVANAINYVNSLDFYAEFGVITVSQIERKVAYLSAKGVRFIVIDHLNIMQPDVSIYSEAEKVNSCAQKAKDWAKKYDVHIFLLAQLNRESLKEGDKTPQVTDIKYGGEAAADIVIMPQRLTDLDDYHSTGFMEVLIHPVKLRDGGRKKGIRMTFVRKKGKIFEGDVSTIGFEVGYS